MKRTLAFFLSLMMVLAMLPASALATEEGSVVPSDSAIAAEDTAVLNEPAASDTEDSGAAAVALDATPGLYWIRLRDAQDGIYASSEVADFMWDEVGQDIDAVFLFWDGAAFEVVPFDALDFPDGLTYERYSSGFDAVHMVFDKPLDVRITYTRGEFVYAFPLEVEDLGGGSDTGGSTIGNSQPTKPAASDLRWHRERYDEGDNEYYAGAASYKGAIDVSLDDFTKYETTFWRVEENGDEEICSFLLNFNDDQDYDTVYPFEEYPELFTTGTYYFTVTALGNGDTCVDGEPMYSDTWYYEQPEAQMTVSNPQWDADMLMVWPPKTTDRDWLLAYDVEFWFNGTEDNPDTARRTSSSWYDMDEFPSPSYDALEDGDGWYYFRVRALSDDIEDMRSSDWTELSEGFYYERPDVTLGPSNLGWDEDTMTISWDDPYADLVDHYQVRFYYAENADDEPMRLRSWRYYPGEDDFQIPAALLKDFGTGHYYYQVRTYTAKPLEANTNAQYSELSAPLYYTGPSEKMPAPTELMWNVSRNSSSGSTYDNPGYISFRGEVIGERTRFNISLFRKETGGDVLLDSFRYTIRSGNSYCSGNLFNDYPELFTTGTYYFTVAAEGDGVNYSDSETVVSDTWYYERPDVTLKVSDPVWNDDMTCCWSDDADNKGFVEYYDIQFNYVPKGGTLNENDWYSWNSYWPDEDDVPTIPGDLLVNQGSGDYYFRVRAMSSDIYQAVPSVWTDWSPAFGYTKPTASLSVSNPVWNDDMTLSWTNDFDDPQLAAYYYICFYRSKDGSVPADLDDWDDRYQFTPGIAWEPSDGWTNTARLLQDLGVGTYYFRVQAVSADPQNLNSSAWSELSAGKYYGGPSQKALAPTDLQWNVERWGTNGMEDALGVVSFACNHLGDYTEYEIQFFRKESTGDVHIGTTHNREWADTNYCSVWPFELFPDQFTTGTYYFTVTALGDGITTSPCDPVTSDTWYYERPDVTLEVSAPIWGDDMQVHWTDAAQNAGNVRYYQVQYQYVSKGGTLRPDNWNWRHTYMANNDWWTLIPHEMLEEYGSGDYYFRVRAVSQDIEVAVTSTFSDWSAAFSYTEPAAKLTVTDPRWDGHAITGSSSFDNSLLAYYEICFYYSADGSKPTNLNTWDDWAEFVSLPADMPHWMVENYGYGTYFFRVRAVSADPTKVRTGDWTELSPGMTLSAPEEKLGNASELQWNVQYIWLWDEETETDVQAPDTRYGSIGFKRADVDQSHYDIDIYRVGEDEPVSENNWGFGSNRNREYLDVSSFIYDDLPSGTYYFKIRAEGDGVNYDHGDWVDSRDYENGVWTYTAPDEQLEKPTGMRWDDRNYTDWEGNDLIAALWFPVDGAGYYEVNFYYSATENGAKEQLGGTFDIDAGDWDIFAELWEDEIARYGDGYYFFKVRAISPDITQIRNGPWSDFSKPYPLGMVTEYAKDTVDAALDLVDSNATQANVQTAVEAVAELPQLSAVLAADTENSETVKQLADLEKKVAEVLNVEIKQPTIEDTALASQLDVSEVQISNMALNVDTDSTQERSVQLKIDKVDETNAPPAMNEALYPDAVQFSMHIDGIKDANGDAPGHKLAVPVKMVMPVPANINPHFLVILHHKLSDNSWEEIWPHVYKEDGKWYATFVVDSFSNFAFASASVSASRSGNQITITTDNLADPNALYWGAVYSKAGQMLGVCPVTNGIGIINTAQANKASYVQLFSIASDGSWEPLDNVLPVNVK